MKTIIVGGGKVGYFLVKTVIANQTVVNMIEKDRERAIQISDELDIDVIQGDGSDISILEEAGIQKAEIVAAVTGDDEENLVVCQIVKVKFPHVKTIARINNPKNIEMFKALGVDKTVCSTKVIADLIEYEMANDTLKILQTFERGNMLLGEISVGEECAWARTLVKNLEIPNDLILVSILRDGHVIFPRGETMIEPYDHVMIVTSPKVVDELRKKL